MDSPSIYNSTTINLNSRCGFGFVSSRRGRYVLLSGQSFLRTPRRHPEISGRVENMAAQPVVDWTFMKQFSRKLREIETHSDYGNIEIVVR